MPASALTSRCTRKSADDRLSVGVDGLAAGVEATLTADAVGKLGRATARALVGVLSCDLVLRTALVCARVTLFLLWDCHKKSEGYQPHLGR